MSQKLQVTYKTKRSSLYYTCRITFAFRREHIENPWPRPASPRQRGVETKAKGVLQERREGARRVVSGIHRDADGFHPSRRQKREKERKLGERKGRDERSGSEREGEIIGGCCCCCRCCCCHRCRCCVRACTRFLLRPSLCLWPLHNCPPPSPFPPVVHAHVRTVDQSPCCLFLLMRNANIRVYISARTLVCACAPARACRRDCVQRA